MKFPIGVRLFFALLISTFSVAAISLLLLSGSVLTIFADYTVKIDLDRLEEISNDITESYARHGNWSFLPQNEEDRRYWFGTSFNRLNEQRAKSKAARTVPSIQAAEPQSQNMLPPPPPKEIVESLNQTPVSLGKTTAQPSDSSHASSSAAAENRQVSAAQSTPQAPQAPPAPPAPPIPPPLPPLPSPISQLPDLDPISTVDPVLLAKNGDLYLRVTLLDRESRYLAGLRDFEINEDFRYLYLHGKHIGYLLVKRSNSRPDEVTNRFLLAYRDNIFRFVLLSILLSAFLATILTIHFRQPIIRLRDGTKLLATGRFDTRMTIRRSDELGELADNFNLMAEKLELLEVERRQWVAETSHELRTPISVIRAQIEAFQDGVRAPTPEHLQILLRQVLAIDKLISDLYEHARLEAGNRILHLEEVRLVNLVEELGVNFKEKLSRAELSFDIKSSISTSFVIMLDTQRFSQVLSNLLENSIRYTAPGGAIVLSLDEDLDQVRLCIEDSAPGLDEQELAQLGQRFYRPDASRSRLHGGSGLGLSLCKRIVEAHQGSILFTASSLGGIAVTMHFPKRPPPASEEKSHD